jgi:hypothetical protein
MGSGKVLKRAIEKHGIENFEKEILAVFDDPEDMLELESQLVNNKFVKSKETYNICEGGRGGFSYINNNGLNLYGKNKENLLLVRHMGPEAARKKVNEDPEKHRKKISEGLKKHYDNGGIGKFRGRKHSDESKQKISRATKGKRRGKLNSQFGTIWIYNEEQMKNKKIKKDESIPDGWKIGRIMDWKNFQEKQ